jgi:hypothetical protein
LKFRFRVAISKCAILLGRTTPPRIRALRFESCLDSCPECHFQGAIFLGCATSNPRTALQITPRFVSSVPFYERNFAGSRNPIYNACMTLRITPRFSLATPFSGRNFIRQRDRESVRCNSNHVWIVARVPFSDAFCWVAQPQLESVHCASNNT